MSNHTDPEIRAASWLSPILQPGGLRTQSELAAHKLNNIEFDAIAFTGLSGSMLSSVLAMNLGKLLYAVRKLDENRHSGYDVEGPSVGLRYIIIDDMIVSGDTMRRIISKVAEKTKGTAVCVGIYLYRDEKLLTNRVDIEFYKKPEGA